MNEFLAIVTLVILIVLIVRTILVWHMRAFLSPALYFGAIWALGVLGVTIFHPVGLLYEPYPQYIDELHILVSFTALCFLFWTKKGRKAVNDKQIQLNFTFDSVYVFFSILLFLIALYDFISLGGNLNMAQARQNVHEIQDSRSVIIGYGHTLLIPLSVYGGYKLVSFLSSGISLFSPKMLFFILPLLSGFIFSVDVGGRVDVVYSFANYFLGMALYLPLHTSVRRYKRVFVWIVLGAFMVTFFISGVANQRDLYGKGYNTDAEIYLTEESPVLGALYGPVSYVVSSYSGYQLRRVDAVDPNQLGYGMYTFNGFINWTLPFSGLIGLGDFSIAKTFGIYYYNQETYDYQRELYYTTHSCYIPMIKDFGFWGSLICIFFLTLISHNAFVAIQKRKSLEYACSLFFYILFWNYWSRSNFYGTLSSTVLMQLYGFLIIDIANLLVGKPRNRSFDYKRHI